MLLPSLRSTIIRSTLIRSNTRLTYVSTQAPAANTNDQVINEVLGKSFTGSSSTLPRPAPAAPIPRTPATLTLDDITPAQDPLLQFFASCMMQGGKRARAEKSTSEILLHLHALTKAPPLPVLRQAVEMAAPAVRVMTHKTGGKVTAKPVALNERQRTRRAIYWILEESDARVGHTRGERVARECIRILQGESRVLELKSKAHQLAMVNRGNLPRTRV